MRQATWRTRVRQLADPVWPGRTVDGYANLIAARLRKLAEEGSTGMLPMPGHGESAIFFRGGQVVYAESSRTPPPRAVSLAALGLVHAQARGSHQGPHEKENPGAAEVPSVSTLAHVLALTEAVIDASTELLSSDYRYAKFRQGNDPPAGHVRRIPVETLLAEVHRRHAVLRQLATILTPDSVVARAPLLDLSSAQISRAQWAVLMRVGGEVTPRALALQLGQSVFGMTIETYRLVALGLLAVPGRQPVPAGQPVPGPPGVAMSFMRAVSGERDSNA